MIPIRDSVPRVHPPVMVYILIALNAVAFILSHALPPGAVELVFKVFGAVPARFTDPSWAAAAGYPDGLVLPAFSYMFLHDGWLHVILNMWMLWVFADNVEDATGHVRFLAFYLCCGLAALGLHILFNQGSDVPVVGASGAIAGVMGAYFVLYPHGRVLTLIPILFIPLFVTIPASLFLGLWFCLQLAYGLIAEASLQAAPIAWWAHAGGFAAGWLLIRAFVRKGRCYHCYNPETKAYDYLDDLDEDLKRGGFRDRHLPPKRKDG